SERIPQVRQAIEYSIALGKVICVSDPAEAAPPDPALIAPPPRRGPPPPPAAPPIRPRRVPGAGALPARPVPPGSGRRRSRTAGHLFLQGEVGCGGVRGRFDDVVGRGFTLLSPAADPASRLDPDLAAFFAALGGTSGRVAPGGPVDDLNGSYAKWFAQHEVG